jgi:hypothetical protein
MAIRLSFGLPDYRGGWLCPLGGEKSALVGRRKSKYRLVLGFIVTCLAMFSA